MHNLYVYLYPRTVWPANLCLNRTAYSSGATRNKWRLSYATGRSRGSAMVLLDVV